MQAIVVRRFGGPEVLVAEAVDEPTPGAGELLVEVAAAGVNFRDRYECEGRPPYRPALPFVPGTEGSGRVVGIGAGVAGVQLGDIVAWTQAAASYAELVTVRAEQAVAVPEGLDPKVAAAVILQGLTAHYLIESTYAVQAGDVVVVHAAAGGVGLLLTQLAAGRGATVVATTSSADKAALARDAGATVACSYEDFVAVAHELGGGRGAQVVYDGVGRATFADSRRALAPRGVLVLYGASSGAVAPIDPIELMTGGSLFLTRPTLAHYVETRAELERRATAVFGAVATGTLSVRIGARFALSEAGRAHEALASRATTGKCILVPGPAVHGD
ncbi:MAG: quinone oxidoreductase [Actinomycetota bacterium]|nr:quinone oxidoreductase [Actinomycetota bacterium]